MWYGFTLLRCRISTSYACKDSTWATKPIPKSSIAFESSDENAIASLVAEDFGIGFVAHVESLQAYDVEILHLSNVKPYHTVYMAYLKNMPMIPAVLNC